MCGKIHISFYSVSANSLDPLCKHVEKMMPLKQQIQERQVRVPGSNSLPARCSSLRLHTQMVISEFAISPDSYEDSSYLRVQESRSPFSPRRECFSCQRFNTKRPILLLELNICLGKAGIRDVSSQRGGMNKLANFSFL